MKFSQEFLQSVISSILSIECAEIEKAAEVLSSLKGRLFIIGSGGGAGHASHAVCDFRKLCGIDALTLENIPEITARTNDEGWNTTALKWLQGSNFNSTDCLMVFSVGGGHDNISGNIVKALNHVKIKGGKIIGIVGRDGGATMELADACILVKTVKYTTPITEGLQSVIAHLLVTHPELKKEEPIW